jgi:predicted phage baseplate assembly protein
MKRLAPTLFDRRFDDLLQLGRSQLPGLAPDWTDYNAHDPGITLMELLAWVAEAQMYSLGRMRRDERAAYAALFGVAPAGTNPTRGLIWADRSDPQSPASTFTSSQVIGLDAKIHPRNSDTPTFRPTYAMLWVPGRVTQLQASYSDGRTRDFTAINERGGPVYLPFGDAAGPQDVLAVRYECRGDGGMFPAARQDAEGTYLMLGVRTDLTASGSGGAQTQPGPGDAVPLSVMLQADTRSYPLPIVSDSTYGMMRTGAVVLDVSAVQGSPLRFTLHVRASRGFPRPPRLLRLDLNVLPIVQGRTISESHPAFGLPDLSFALETPGLRFDAGQEPLQLVVDDTSGETAWQRCERLSDRGPDENVFEFDAAAAVVTFGNGINGRIPSENATVVVTYAVCDGAQGAAPRNRQWHVDGFEGSFGTNPDPVVGGRDATDSTSQRREARRHARDDRPIVTGADLVDAALALPVLEVARAWILESGLQAPQTGVTTLVVMRARPGGVEPEGTPETRLWLETIRRRLLGRITLGTRLNVIAPTYVAFQVSATLMALAARDPATIKAAAMDALRERLALVDIGSGTPRAPGVPVTRLDLTAWLRRIDGVARVVDVQLTLTTGTRVDQVDVPPDGLPRFDAAQSTIDVQRANAGGVS